MLAKKKKVKKSPKNEDNILKYIHLAIDTEKRGIKFYTEAKNTVDDYGMSRLMDVLLEQEHIHLKFFTEVYNAEKKKGILDAAKKAGSYHGQAPIKNPLFGMQQLHTVTKQKSTIYHLFNQAIEFEQRGHDLYMELAKKIKNKRISDFLKMIAHEELRHRDFIRMHQDAIYDTGYWLGMEHVRLQT
ncbi:ferritin-like domain-containing protein [archaeon]|nr:ferritin-like domain-containing protein [archaeon]